MSDEQEAQTEERTISRIEMFSDNRGVTIKVTTPIGGGKARYIGLGAAQVVMKTPDGPRAQNVPIDFPIDSETIAGAFDKYEESAQEYVKQRNQKSRIIQATSMPPTLVLPPSLRPGRNGPGMIGGGAVIGG